MRVWTNTSFKAFDLLSTPSPASGTRASTDGGKDESHLVDVQSVLDRAVAERTPCVLVRQDPGTRPLPIETTLESITAHAIAIGRPSYRPGQKSLAAGERLQLRIELPEGSYIADTAVVAKLESTSGASAYRLARPHSLILEDRRIVDRVSVAYETAPVAELLHAPTHKSIGSGALIDLSVGGVRIRTSPQVLIRAGDRIVLRAKLNDDVRIHAMGIVVHTGPRTDGAVDVGVRFTGEVPDVNRYLREISARGTARRAG